MLRRKPPKRRRRPCELRRRPLKRRHWQMPPIALGGARDCWRVGREDSNDREDGLRLAVVEVPSGLRSIERMARGIHCELLQDGTLVLTGTGATRSAVFNQTYSLDTLRLELDANRVNFHGSTAMLKAIPGQSSL